MNYIKLIRRIFFFVAYKSITFYSFHVDIYRNIERVIFHQLHGVVSNTYVLAPGTVCIGIPIKKNNNRRSQLSS